MNTVIPVKPALFENESRIAVFIPNEENIKNLIRKVPNSRWSPSLQCWHFLNTPENWAIFQHHLQGFDLNIQKNAPPLSIPKSEIWAYSKGVFKKEKAISNTPELHIYPLSRNGEKRIAVINLKFDADFPALMNQIDGRLWTPDCNCWHIPNTKEAWQHLQLLFKNYRIVKQQSPIAVHVLPQLETQNSKPHSSPSKDDEVRTLLSFSTKIIARRCAEMPNRIFLIFPTERTDWTNYVQEVKDSFWYAEDNVWSVPRTKELFEQFKAYFGEQLVVDKQTPFVLKETNEQEPPQYPSLENKITISETSTESSVWCLHLPKTMIDIHLSIIKNIHGKKWNTRYSVWEVPKTQLTLRFIEKYLKDVTHWTCEIKQGLPDRIETNNSSEHARKAIEDKFVPAKHESAVLALEQTLTLKRYSWRTIKNYTNTFRQYIRYFDDIHPDDLTRGDINKYILWCIKEKRITESYQNQILSAIKMYYTEVVSQELKVLELIRPKKEQKLPQVLSTEEVTRLIKSTENIKHNCILTLIYSAGLRLGELINLRIADIQMENKRVFVKSGKGKKDRYTVLAPKALVKIKQYLEIYRPVEWLFEGQTGGQYAARSVQNIFTKAKELSRVNPYSTTHTLRHSFASHLYDNGYDIYMIKDMLGHADIKTTEIYIQISKRGRENLKSPLDDLDI